jgi:hypothetical protein
MSESKVQEPKKMAETKPLQVWNGHWRDRRHVYVAAYNRADAGRLLETAAGESIPAIDREIRDYFHETWGKPMEGITPERGVWVQSGSRLSKPVRVV